MTAHSMIGLTLAAFLAGGAAAPSPPAPKAANGAAQTPLQSPAAPRRPPHGCDIKNRYYPDKAKRLGVDGRVLLYCRVELTGKLSDCDVASESPRNFGFGDAALCMTALMKMKTVDKSGASIVGTRVPVPVNFNLPD